MAPGHPDGGRVQLIGERDGLILKSGSEVLPGAFHNEFVPRKSVLYQDGG
jgi:hypothetical protein